MSLYRPEPLPVHMDAQSSGRIAILLVNLGTPAAPTTGAVRTYLAQFLSDRRVVELPKWLWWPILHGIILRVRPAKSAAKYASIWQAGGSPLRVITAAQAEALQALISQTAPDVTVRYAMRYGEPSIPGMLDALKQEGFGRIALVPLYPQYAASTTATVVDELARWLLQTRNQPEVRYVRDFADDANYIEALAQQVRKHWALHGPLGADGRLLMSFHGLPQSAVDAGDPYAARCLLTGQLVAERLGLSSEQYLITFQSRFGRAQWLQPYTAETVKHLPEQGVRRLDVLCPGFVADCLETLEEIAQEVRDDFLGAGGQTFHYLPCLNTAPEWLDALAGVCQKVIQSWRV